jgi:hypothetical protein
MDIVTKTPQGYLASVALYSCQMLDRDKEAVIAALAGSMANVPGQRGPRLGTFTALVAAGLKDSAKINFGEVEHRGRFQSGDWNSGLGYGEGTVQKIGKPDKDGWVQITFAKKMQKEERCLASNQTNELTRILPDGTLVFAHNCTKWGLVAVDKTPDPIKVYKRYATAVKPGVNVLAFGGVVAAVFPKNKRTPIAIAGVAVK